MFAGNKVRLLASLLAVSTLIVPAFSSTVYAVKDGEGEIVSETEEFVLPDIIDTQEAKELGLKARAYDKETNLFTFVFDNEDGTGTMKVFKHPVKYYDENGDIRDITLKLEQTEDGGYKSADNSIISSFSQKLSDGIGVSCENISISMKPVTVNEGYAECDDLRKVSYQTDEYTAYEYQLTYTGYKEDIVVSQYTGQTEYDFILNTNGLELYEESGSYSLRDSEGNISAEIGDIFVYSADNKNNTLGSITYETIKENDEYRLTVHVDEEYLSSEDTVYPVTIDPTISINYQSSGSSIDDANVCSGYNYVDNETTRLFVGKRTNKGKSRFLMSFHNLDLSSIHASSNVTGAYVQLREAGATGYTHYSSEMTVYCYMFNGSWTPSAVTWSNADFANNVYTCVNSKVVSDDITETNDNKYKFNIAKAVKRWVDAKDIPASYNVFRPYRGLLFSADTNVENGSEFFKVFASYNIGTVLSPSLTITFTNSINRNQFFTKYDPQKYNSDITLNYNISDLYRYRVNCYGYAFGLLYENVVNDLENTYNKQIPGQFSYGQQTYSYTESNATALMNKIETNIIGDASAISSCTDCDYTVSLLSLNSGMTVLPQKGTNSRLIAVVADVVGTGISSNIFHFYMQNSDGTWSHKPGLDNISNLSFPDSSGKQYILTNENILSRAKSGDYSNSIIRFYEITKSHTDLPYLYNAPYEYYEPMVGDYLETPKSYSGSISLQNICLDTPNDVDVYYFSCTQSRSYTFSAVNPYYVSGAKNYTIALYTSTGGLLSSNTSNSNATFSYSLTAGTYYYISVYSNSMNNSTYYNGSPYGYTLSVN